MHHPAIRHVAIAFDQPAADQAVDDGGYRCLAEIDLAGDPRRGHFAVVADGAQYQNLWRGQAGFALERSEEHTSELQSLMRISYAVFCLKKKTQQKTTTLTVLSLST